MDRIAMRTSRRTYIYSFFRINTCVLILAVFLFIVLPSSILAAGDEVYGKRGGEITLAPGSLSGPLTRIVWRHGDDKAIEWEGGLPDAYRQFNGSTSLDTKTGEMRITKLDPIFNGDYSADVNGIQATKKWKLTVLDPVSKPIIGKECNESTCVLSCKNEATVKVQCAWRNGEEELRQSDGTLKLEKTDGEIGKAYICNCSNPVSFAVSDAIVPFPPEPPVILIVGLLSVFIIIIIIGVIPFIFRKELMEYVRTHLWMRAEPIYENAAIKMELMRTSQDTPLKGDTPSGPNA